MPSGPRLPAWPGRPSSRRDVCCDAPGRRVGRAGVSGEPACRASRRVGRAGVSGEPACRASRRVGRAGVSGKGRARWFSTSRIRPAVGNLLCPRTPRWHWTCNCLAVFVIGASVIDAVVQGVAGRELYATGGDAALIRTVTYRYRQGNSYGGFITVPSRVAEVVVRHDLRPSSARAGSCAACSIVRSIRIRSMRWSCTASPLRTERGLNAD